MSSSLRGTLAKLAVFVVASLVLTTIVFSSLLNRPSTSQTSYAADVTDATGLHSGNTVRIAGVKVGTVSGVELRGTTARVRFTVDSAQRLTTTTTVAINYADLLGQRFVNLLPGATAGERLRPGAVVPVQRTKPALDLTAVFNGFQPLFSALQPDQVNQLAGSIVQVFQGQSGTVEDLFRQTAVLTTHLADRQQLIDSVLRNLSTLLDQVGSHDQQLGQLIDSFDSLLSGLAADGQQLGSAVTGLGQLTTGLGDLLSQAQPSLDSDISRLGSVTGTLAGQQDALDRAVKGLPDLLTTFTKPLSTGSFLNAYLCNLTVTLDQPGNTSDTVPLLISLNPQVAPAPDLAPGPVELPHRTVVGAGTTSSEVCR